MISLIFIFFSSYAVSAGTDSGESSSSYSDSNVDTSLEFNKAKKLIYKNRFKLALDILKSIEKETPSGYSKADLYNYLGFANRKLGNLDKASYNYRKALEISPKHKGALEYQGEMYLTLGKLEKAEENLKKLESICFLGCEEEKILKETIAK